MTPSIQQQYVPGWQHCFGCGPHNPHGLHITSYWTGEGAIATFQAQPFHCAAPGFLYGGLIASLIDCHGIVTASAAAHQARGRTFDGEPLPRFVTGALQVRYLKPTPMDHPITLRAHATEISRRKVVVTCELLTAGEVRAVGEIVAIEVAKTFMLETARLPGQVV